MPLDLDLIRAAAGERRVVWLESTESTMIDAAKLAAQGCPSGTVVIAEEQRSGQGRLGRSWHSEPETGLYASIVLRLELPSETAPALTLALGLAAAEAIRAQSGIECDLRWPNDVLIGNKKCAGILVHSGPALYLAGIGINVNQPAFPKDLEGIATSLRIATGKLQSRELLLVRLLEEVDRLVAMLVNEGRARIFQTFTAASSYVRGKHVLVDGRTEGVTEGLDDSGFLLLRTPDGRLTTILAGGVRSL